MRWAAQVHFLSTAHHFFTDNEQGLPPIFYELLHDLVADLGTADAADDDATADDAAACAGPAQHTLRATLQLLYHILQAPLHPCDGCQSQFDAYATMHAERSEIIAKYKEHRAHDALFDADGGWRSEWLDPQLRDALKALDETGDATSLNGLLRRCDEGAPPASAPDATAAARSAGVAHSRLVPRATARLRVCWCQHTHTHAHTHTHTRAHTHTHTRPCPRACTRAQPTGVCLFTQGSLHSLC